MNLSAFSFGIHACFFGLDFLSNNFFLTRLQNTGLAFVATLVSSFFFNAAKNMVAVINIVQKKTEQLRVQPEKLIADGSFERKNKFIIIRLT
jgi:hypothetical protein